MKNSFKKLIAIILCMAMVICDTVIYFAEENVDENVVATSVEDYNDNVEIASDEISTTNSENLSDEDDNLFSEATNSSDTNSLDLNEISTSVSGSSDDFVTGDTFLSDNTTTDDSDENLDTSSESTTESITESETTTVSMETDSTTMSLTNTNSNNNQSSNIVEEEKVATISVAEQNQISVESDNSDSGENNNSNNVLNDDINISNIATISEAINVFNIATISEATLNQFNIYDIATASEIILATVSNAIYGDNENYGTGFLKLDYEAPFATPLFRNNLFGTTIPSSYDSRSLTNPANTSMSIVPPVRNQGAYETCWAFSTIGMMEINGRKKGLFTSETEANLSEAAVTYFVYDGMKQALDSSQADYNDSIDRPGVEGYDKTYLSSASPHFANRRGRQDIAALAMTSFLGATVENDDTRYENLATIISNFQSTGRGLPGRYAFNNNSVVIKDVKFINKSNTNLIKQAIMDYGSVGISYYEGGGNTYYKNVGSEYYRYCSSGLANHAILIVGWDDSVPVTNFNTSPSQPGAWLCRNSYGDSYTYSNGGYFWLSYQDATLDGTVYAIEVVKGDKYDYNYHYDTTGEICPKLYNFTVSETNPLRFANVFRVSNDNRQVLNAVSVGVYSTNSKFNIKIYTKDTAMSFPSDGTLALEMTGIEKDAAGVYTIELDDPVVLDAGTYYSIVIEGTGGTANSSNQFAVYVSQKQANIETIQFRNAAALNQTYYGYGNIANATSWADMNQSGITNIDGVDCGINARIKGLTNIGDLIIRFDGNGADNTMSPQAMENGVAANIKTNTFTKHGYTFNGWKVVGTNAPYGDGASITITSDTTLRAEWTPVVYSINYNANGGTVSPTNFNKTYGVAYTGTFASPAKLGYDFVGWYVDNNTFANEFTTTTDIYNETATTYEIYAKWSPKTYTINYNANGGTASATSFNKTYGAAFSGTFANATKLGYTFGGWYVDNNTFTTPYTNTTDIYQDGVTTFEVFAKWTAIDYAITLNVGAGGEVSPTTVNKTYGTNINTTTIPTPTKLGYNFAGWFKESSCDTAYTGDDSIYVAGQTNYIYAKWTPITYTLNLNALGGTGSTSLPTQYTYGTALNLPMDYTKEGNNIVGWYTEYDSATESYSGTRYVSIPALATNEIIPNDSTTPIVLYAKYAEIYYITFVAGGGTGSMAMQATYEGVPVVLNANSFYRSGYSFSRWRASNGLTYNNRANIGILHSSLILTAEWTKNKSGGGGTNGGGGGSGGGSAIPATNALKNNETTTLNVSFNDVPLSFANTTNSSWVADATGKWHLNKVNTLGQIEEVKSSWLCLDVEANVNGVKTIVKDFYYFNGNGEMLTGWLTDGTTKKYYLDQSNSSEMGKMVRGWKLIGTNYYYFNQDGTLFTSGLTPDGYAVDANGIWLK